MISRSSTCRPKILVSFFLFFSLGLLSRPAFAQVDLSGYWGQKMTEDQPERGPGPEIGDYTGMPMKEGTA